MNTPGMKDVAIMIKSEVMPKLWTDKQINRQEILLFPSPIFLTMAGSRKVGMAMDWSKPQCNY